MPFQIPSPRISLPLLAALTLFLAGGVMAGVDLAITISAMQRQN